MSRVLFTIVIIILVMSGGAMWYVENFSAHVYYVQIHKNGERDMDDKDKNQNIQSFRYEIEGFDSEGGEKLLDFTADHNLRINAYLKVLDNAKRGIIRWEEVKREDVPKNALYKLEAKRLN